MDALIQHVKQLAITADATARQKLLVTLRDVAASIEDPTDTLNRFGYLVGKMIYLSLLTCVEANLMSADIAIAPSNRCCSHRLRLRALQILGEGPWTSHCWPDRGRDRR